MSITTGARIRRYERLSGVDHPRCAACNWPPELLDDLPFVDFDAALHRGTLIRSYDRFPVLSVDFVVLCAECVAKAALLIDPQPAKQYRDDVESLKGELADRLATATREAKEQVDEQKRKERRLADLQAAQEERERLEAAARAWCGDWDRSLAEAQDSRVKLWTWQRAVNAGDDWAKAELEAERKALAKLERTLTAQRKAGGAIRGQCTEHGLEPLAAPIWERLTRDEGGD